MRRTNVIVRGIGARLVRQFIGWREPGTAGPETEHYCCVISHLGACSSSDALLLEMRQGPSGLRPTSRNVRSAGQPLLMQQQRSVFRKDRLD